MHALNELNYNSTWKMATLAKEIFLSYSRQEALKPFVVRVKRDLEAQGLTVWLDIEDIPEGK